MVLLGGGEHRRGPLELRRLRGPSCAFKLSAFEIPPTESGGDPPRRACLAVASKTTEGPPSIHRRATVRRLGSFPSILSKRPSTGSTAKHRKSLDSLSTPKVLPDLRSLTSLQMTLEGAHGDARDLAKNTTKKNSDLSIGVFLFARAPGRARVAPAPVCAARARGLISRAHAWYISTRACAGAWRGRTMQSTLVCARFSFSFFRVSVALGKSLAGGGRNWRFCIR